MKRIRALTKPRARKPKWLAGKSMYRGVLMNAMTVGGVVCTRVAVEPSAEESLPDHYVKGYLR